MQGFDLCDEWDVVCGTVVAANALYEGEWTRNFEGEEDQSQNGIEMSLSKVCSLRLVYQ